MPFNTIRNEDFLNLIRRRAQRLFCGIVYLVSQKSVDKPLTRPLLGDLLSQSMQVEELLDSYGARNNQQWNLFRSLTATIKLFSNVSYELLHIEHSIISYRLLPLGQDFTKATERTLDFTRCILFETGERMLKQATDLGLRVPELGPCLDMYKESLPPGRLKQNIESRHIETVSKTVSTVATAFLNLAAASKPSLPCKRIQKEEYQSYIEGPITEEKLRSLEFQFHNLQSLYDTYVSKTETEGLDKELPILRGHISVVLHLLRTATDFAHYYERHIDRKTQLRGQNIQNVVDPGKLLSKLMNYSVSFAGQYLASAEVLCQEMLQRYIEIDTIEVKVPQYRGFHVRPSTLVAKLVLHYGSKVQMELDGEYYDASSPLELFRANEAINSQKRKWLAQEIMDMKLVPDTYDKEDLLTVIRDIIITLAEKSRIVIYEQPLNLGEQPLQRDTTLAEQLKEEIARLLAVGKIDIGTNLKTRFIGDKRVLSDIRLLAENGYGEDNFGNNIALPPGLEYLRKS